MVVVSLGRMRCLGLTLRNVNGMSGESGSLPDQTAFFGEERRDFAADEFVGDGFVGVGVEFVGVGHFPRAAEGAVVVAHPCWRDCQFECSEIVRLILSQDLPVPIVSTLVFLA